MKNWIKNHQWVEILTLLLIILALVITIGKELKTIGYMKANKEVASAIRVVEEESNLITTEEDYNNLLKECREFIYNNYTSSSSVSTYVVVDEDLYIDSTDSSISNRESFFNHANAVYCKGMMLVTFLSDSGELKSVAAAIDKKADTIKVIDIDSLRSFEKFNEYDTDEELNNISEIILNILKSETHKLDIKTTYKYFTDNGYRDFIAELDKNSKIDNAGVAFIKFGKSKQDIEYNDRIILQIVANDESESKEVYITTLIKINKDNKIFDIDIL